MNAQISLKNQIDVPKELAGADDDIASLEFLDGTVFQKPLDGFQVHIFKQTDTLQIPFADAAGHFPSPQMFSEKIPELACNTILIYNKISRIVKKEGLALSPGLSP